LNGSRKAGLGTWLVAAACATLAIYPCVSRQARLRDNDQRLAQLKARLAARPQQRALSTPPLSLRVERLAGLLASWETIGGCGAGSSTGAGGGVKWIGRSTSGGLFNLQTQASYLHLKDGYNLSLTTQISKDLGEKWNVGLSVPLLYKYYRDYYGLPVDISNGGLGDVSGSITRRFGEINATALTLSIGAPTGRHDATYKGDYLTQEKQLGAGRPSGSLTLDHTMDEQWGLIVLGGTGAYRGGENELGNYRAPSAGIYGYCGYYAGPWVPSLGLSVQRFFGVDRDRGLDQQVQLMSATGTIALEWSTDWLAILAGASLPFGWEGTEGPDGGENDLQTPGFQPWTVSIGFSVSPF
jgi:hypothetical protein